MPEKLYKVSTKIADSYEIAAQVRGHTVQIDQQRPVGRDLAPNPVEYFLMSLGGCICTITKTIAEQRNIPLKSVETKVEGKINTDFLLGETTEGRAGFYEIVVYTKIDAPLGDAEKEALLREVEARCPVSENISNLSLVRVVST